MRKQCKIEIFDRDIVYKSSRVIGWPQISFDYLTLEQATIDIPEISVSKGDFVHITDMNGNVIHQGIATAPSVQNGILSLGITPILSLFDITVSYDRTDLQSGTLENFIAGIISARYITNADTLERIPMTVTVTSSTSDTALNLKSNVHELWDIASSAMTGYGIVISAELKPSDKQINVTIGKVGSSTQIVEADKENCVESVYTIGDDYGATNKMTLINKNNESETVTYYLHTDGTINTTNSNRITPVFETVEYVESSGVFADDAQSRALEALTPQEHDNLIELTFRHDDKLIDLSGMAIGQVVNILHDGNVYKSILTGKQKSELNTKLIFGNVRVDLTKKLVLDKRRK